MTSCIACEHRDTACHYWCRSFY